MVDKKDKFRNELVGELTIRDHFALVALNGMLSSERDMNLDAFTRKAYEFADSMLIAREKN